MNTADEDAQMERDEWASREVMPITNWGRRPDGSEIVQYDAPMFFSFTEHSLLHQYPICVRNAIGMSTLNSPTSSMGICGISSTEKQSGSMRAGDFRQLTSAALRFHQGRFRLRILLHVAQSG